MTSRACWPPHSPLACLPIPPPRFVQFAVPGDNSVDLFTNDLGIVVIMNDAGEVEGYNLLAGGGMGERSASFVAAAGCLVRPRCGLGAGGGLHPVGRQRHG